MLGASASGNDCQIEDVQRAGPDGTDGVGGGRAVYNLLIIRNLRSCEIGVNFNKRWRDFSQNFCPYLIGQSMRKMMF